ncbi:MAG: hypothetical protein ACE5JX_22825, partial [Acidobacteriota bacterium]
DPSAEPEEVVSAPSGKTDDEPLKALDIEVEGAARKDSPLAENVPLVPTPESGGGDTTPSVVRDSKQAADSGSLDQPEPVPVAGGREPAHRELDEPSEEAAGRTEVPVGVGEETVSAEDDLLHALGAQPSLPRRFHLIHCHLAAARQIDDPGGLLRAFPPGWSRRRVLSTLLRTGLITDFDQALSLIASLESPLDEFWCVSTLIESRKLDSRQLETLARAARSNSSRRLVRRRQSRSG